MTAACVTNPATATRVLPDRHEPGCTGSGCLGCQPCGEQHCARCGRNHATVTCATCLAMARNNLDTIATLSERLAVEATQGRKALAVGADVPGGDALVMLSPGATSHGYRAQLAHRHANGLDTGHTQEELRGDPTPPLALLLRWETAWRNKRHQPTDLAPTMARVVAYLSDHLHLLAQDPLFLAFSSDLSRAARGLEDVLHEGERPEVTRVPCWECGTRLVKVYADAAKDDHWLCPRCHERYDRGRFDRAKHDHLASRGADRYVSLADAIATVGRPEQTVRAWVRRGLVDAVRDPATKRLVVWWPHVRAQHLAAQERKRA